MSVGMAAPCPQPSLSAAGGAPAEDHIEILLGSNPPPHTLSLQFTVMAFSKWESEVLKASRGGEDE